MVYTGTSDIGQGSSSVMATIVAEELGLRMDQVRVVAADTDLTPVDLGAYSSRITLMAGNAAVDAARKLRRQVQETTDEPAPICSIECAQREHRCARSELQESPGAVGTHRELLVSDREDQEDGATARLAGHPRREVHAIEAPLCVVDPHRVLLPRNPLDLLSVARDAVEHRLGQSLDLIEADAPVLVHQWAGFEDLRPADVHG